MLKKTITFIDYNDVERTQDFYFNLNAAEIAEMEMSVNGGLIQFIDRIVAKQDAPTLIAMFKDFILKTIGEKSPDGIQFIKNDEIRKRFEQSEAYVALYMELISDDVAASNFVNGVIPKKKPNLPPA